MNLQKNNDNKNSEESTIYLNSMSENIINNKLLKNENNNNDNEKMKIYNDLYNSLNKDIFIIQFGYMLINEENIKKEKFYKDHIQRLFIRKKLTTLINFTKIKI